MSAHLDTDGSDLHVKARTPEGLERVCSVCGYAEFDNFPHRTNPDGGWDTIQVHGGSAIVVYVPEPRVLQ